MEGNIHDEKTAVWDGRYREYEKPKDGQHIKIKLSNEKMIGVKYFSLIILILVCLNIYFRLDSISDVYISEVEYLYIQYASTVLVEGSLKYCFFSQYKFRVIKESIRMKKLVLMAVLMFSVLVMASCGVSSIGGNIIKDEGDLVKIMDEFKKIDDLKGKDILVFQDVNVYTGEMGNRVIINILKPGTDDQVDNYEYSGGWSKARPVQLSGEGKAIDNCIPIEKLDFSKVPQMYREMEVKIKDIEGAKISDYFSFKFWRGEWYGSLRAESPRAKYFAKFDLNGGLRKFEKN